MKKILLRERGGNLKGISLIETLVVMTLSAVLAGIIVTGIAAVMRYNDSTHHHRTQQTALRQFCATLRKDIHLSLQCEWDPELQSLQLDFSGPTEITYKKLENRWVRIAAAAKDSSATTSFHLDEAFRCYCLDAQRGRGELLHLTLSNHPLETGNPKDQAVREMRSEIVAMVGRDSSSSPKRVTDTIK